ncbi:MAG: N-acetyltransferase family protein [Cuspidothrix sp.]
MLNPINSELAWKYWFFRFPHPPSTPKTTNPSIGHLQIRVATPDDLMDIAQIVTESFHSQNGLWGWAFPLFRLGIYEDLRHRLRFPTPHHVCLVAVDTAATNQKIMGTIEMSVRLIDTWPGLNQSFPYISNLAVASGYRRLGVACSLLVRCEQISQRWGFQDLYLHVLENNHQARQLYGKLAYRVYKVESPWNALALNPSRQILLHKHI